MDTELGTALIGAGAIVLGALIAVGSGIVSAVLARRTELESRKAAVDDAQRVWLRDEKQRGYVRFLGLADDLYKLLVSVHHSKAQRSSEANIEAIYDAYTRAETAVTELKLLGAVGAVAAEAERGALFKLFEVVADHPESPNPESKMLWNDEHKKWRALRDDLLEQAQVDLGITITDAEITKPHT